jgi:ferredoxin-like protein FixX
MFYFFYKREAYTHERSGDPGSYQVEYCPFVLIKPLQSPEYENTRGKCPARCYFNFNRKLVISESQCLFSAACFI